MDLRILPNDNQDNNEMIWKQIQKINSQKIIELQEKAQEIAIKYNIDLLFDINSAIIGRLKPYYSKKVYDEFGITCGLEAVKQFTQCLMEINSLAREMYYVYYKTMNDSYLEKEKLETIERYKELRKIGVKTKESLINNTDWINGSSDSLFIERIENNGNNEKFNVGIKNDGSGYDSVYLEISKILDANSYPDFWIGNLNTKEVFETVEQYVDEIIKKLEQMNGDEYREYKISQMLLINEEKELFNEHLKDLSEEKNSNRKI